MTAKRKDNHSTEFGLWLREQSKIDSRLGYVATNIDYLWSNYKTNKWMLLEEKRYNTPVKLWQMQLFKKMDACARNVTGYCGFHIILFENTNPEDGKVIIDGSVVTAQDLIEFLAFEKDENWYKLNIFI